MAAMSLFDGPEYASYIALCRELRLERRPRDGDWFFDGEEVVLYHGAYCNEYGPYEPEWPEFVWLPRLDQWLAMLEEAGLPDVFFVPRWAVGQFQVWREGQKTMTGPCGEGSSREEAAARLFLALTGRTVTSG